MARLGFGDEAPTLDERVRELNRVVDLLVYKFREEFGILLDFSPRSIHFLDAVLSEARRSGALTSGLFLSIGGYAGETLVRSCGGRWEDHEGVLGIEVSEHGLVRHIRVFDWVEGAYEDPRTCNLTYRFQALHGGKRWDAGQGARA